MIPRALWALPAVLAWLACLGGFDWELVTLLGGAVALGGTAARRSGTAFGDVVLAAGLALGCVLMLAAGHGILPQAAATALPYLALGAAAALCDRRALVAAGALLVAQALLPLVGDATAPLGQAVGLGIATGAAIFALGMALRMPPARSMVLAPATPRGAPVWSVPRAPCGVTGVVVQAERATDGTVRLAVAGAAPGYMRVTVT